MTGEVTAIRENGAASGVGVLATSVRSNDAYAWDRHYNVNRGYGVSGLNQLTSSGSLRLAYDGRGNLTSDRSATFGYSAENLLTSAPGATLAYDPLMRLYQTQGSVTTRFQYDGTDLIAEHDASGALQRRDVHGPGFDEPLAWYEGAGTTSRCWLHADERGSVIAVTDSSGATLAINSYDAWGIPAASNMGRFQYTGQAWIPEIGMYHYKARIYSPTLGRFLQTDPVGYEDQVNLYAYAGNDPVNGSDPTGMVEANTCSRAGGSACSGNYAGDGIHSVPTSPKEREALAAGNADAYWDSRQKRGDPIGKLGAAFDLDHKGDENVEHAKKLLLNNLERKHGAVNYNEYGLSVTYGGDAAAFIEEYNEIRLELAKAHMNSTDNDSNVVRHALSAKQITDYHWSVFADHGLPKATFGGTRVTGSYIDVWTYGGIWCGNCDNE